MSSSRQGLLTLLISLFIFSACKNSFDVGLDVDAAKQVGQNVIDTATIRTVTVKEDSTVMNALSQHPFGYLDDSDIGTTRSDLAAALTLSSSSITWGGYTRIDSAVLVLKYGTEFLGDSVNSTYRIDVHELSEPFNVAKTYYDSKSWVFNPTVIGGKKINRFYPKKNVSVVEPVAGKKDSTYNRGPHLRIPLDTAFIRSRFVNAPDGTFSTSTAFNSYFSGLYLNINRAQSSGKGGLATFNLVSGDSSQVRIYYRNFNTSSTIDTLVTVFGLSSAGSAAAVTHTYIPAVQNQLDNPTQQFATTFTQPMAGLRTKVTFPYIDKLKALGNILINKAELIVTAVPSTLDPASRLTLYRTDIAGQRQPVPDNNIGQRGSADQRSLSEIDFGGFYDSTSKVYVFNVTSYVQDLVGGKLSQYNTFIAPIQPNNSRANGDVSPVANTVGRAVLGGGNSSQYKMKLKIIYTKVTL